MSAPAPLRILMLADVPPNPNSGAAGTELRLAEELEQLGHQVVRVWADDLPHRIRHWNLHHLLEQPRAYRTAIEKLSIERDFDVLHVNQPAGWLAARAHRRRRGRALFAHRSHGFEPRIGAAVERWAKVYPEDHRGLLRRTASGVLAPHFDRHYRSIVREADSHVVSCTECADFLTGCGVERDRIHVGPQAPPDQFLAAPPAPWSEERARRLLYVGQHAFVKAPMVVAAVFAAMLAESSSSEATWVAEGSAHPAIRLRLAQAGAPDRVRLLDWMGPESLRSVYDAHGVFLFPSFAEGFGKAFLEAMARGLAVVATAQGGARDLIRSGENGLLAPIGDVGGLLAHLRRLRAESGLAASLGASGRRTAEAHTWRRAASDLAEFYRARLAAKERAA